MKKLNLNDLSVESFATGAYPERRGTVQANSGVSAFGHPGCQTYGCTNTNSEDYNTCLSACENTEGPQNSCAALIHTGCC